MIKPGFERFAAYNMWANRLILDAASALSPQDFVADGGAFFGSVCGTLNHLIVADRVWLRRLTGQGPEERQLNRIITEDIAELRVLRTVEDQRLADFVAGCTEADLGGDFSYRTIAGVEQRQPLEEALTHIFNHQTHHRGQAHALITRFGGQGPEMDLLYYVRSLSA